MTLNKHKLFQDFEDLQNGLISKKIHISNIKSLNEIFNQWKSIIPNLTFELNYYIELLYTVTNTPIKIKITNSQIFESTCTYYKTTYDLIWDIDKATSLIKTKKLKSIDYPIDKLNLQDTEINSDKITAIKNKHEENNAIIIAQIANSNQHFVIDGIHRTYLAKKNGKEFIKAYVLSIDETIDCLLTQEYQTIYKVFHNLYLINTMLHNQTLSKIYYSKIYNEFGIYQLRTNQNEIENATINLNNLSKNIDYKNLDMKPKRKLNSIFKWIAIFLGITIFLVIISSILKT